MKSPRGRFFDRMGYMKNEIVEKAKIHFLETFEKKKSPIYSYLPRHVAEAEKWAKKILQKYPKADEKVVLLSVWLHDIGQAIGDDNDDHAVNSENEARRFLRVIGMAPEKIEKVAHCVRTHRCKDIQPESLEAKILAAVDSVSHMTDFCYIDMISKYSKDFVLAKLKRDYRDIGLLPELQKEITSLYEAWKKLLSVYPD